MVNGVKTRQLLTQYCWMSLLGTRVMLKSTGTFFRHLHLLSGALPKGLWRDLGANRSCGDGSGSKDIYRAMRGCH